MFNSSQKIVEVWTVKVRYDVRIVEWILLELSFWVRLEEAWIEMYVAILRGFDLKSLNYKCFEVVER
jgi:hypothetical protein